MSQSNTILQENKDEIDLVSHIVSRLKDGANLFLTGPGGTGKSFTTRKVLQRFKNPIILAPTSMAAMNVGGETLHKFFMLGISRDLEDMREKDKKFLESYMERTGKSAGAAKQSLFANLSRMLHMTDLIGIDEISMTSREHLDMIMDRINEFGPPPSRRPPILAIGDLLQLPPVQAGLAIYSPFWDFEVVRLSKVYRTSDKEFYTVQNHIRRGLCTERVKKFIQPRVHTLPKSDKAVILAPQNRQVDAHNAAELQRLPGNIHKFLANIVVFNDRLTMAQQNKFVEGLPISQEIDLKPGARVMLTVNKYGEYGQLEYYNGQTGVYQGFEDDVIHILADNGKELQIRRHPFAMEKNQITSKAEKDRQNALLQKGPSQQSPGAGDQWEQQIAQVAEMIVEQFPIRLAYSLTIHKSQGQSLDAVHIHCPGIRTEGQFYVAFSRCKNPDQLSLYGFSPSNIIAVKECVDYYLGLQGDARHLLL